MYGIGENSPESTCVAKGLYLLIDNQPTIDPTTQKISGSTYVIDEPNKQVNKNYTVYTYTQAELDAMAQEKLEAEARRGLNSTTAYMPTDINGTLTPKEKADLDDYRLSCINILGGATTPIEKVTEVDALKAKYKI
jgi:hypothetical protein